MEKKVPKYRIKHVGLNNPDNESAWEATNILCRVFDLEPLDETSTHIFAGDLFEVKKNYSRGKYGHIAMQTDDVEAAIEHLASKGIGILKDSVRRDKNGKITFVYLDLDFEVCGFSFHLCT